MIVSATDFPSLNNSLPCLIHIDDSQSCGDNRQTFRTSLFY